jgi:hypothetical protein
MRKIFSTRQIPKKSLIRLHILGFGYVCVSVYDNNEHYIALLSENVLSEKICIGSSVESYLWLDGDSSYEFMLNINAVICGKPAFIFCAHTYEIKHNYSKKCITAEVDIPISFIMFNMGLADKGISAEKIITHEGSIVLIEDREAVLKTDISIIEKCFVKFNIQINNENIEIFGRAEEINPEKYIYNIKYIGMSEKIRNIIRNYIYDVYKE